MSRLPVPGSDTGTWGDILNDFLSQSLNSDGTIKSSAVPSAWPLTTDVSAGGFSIEDLAGISLDDSYLVLGADPELYFSSASGDSYIDAYLAGDDEGGYFDLNLASGEDVFLNVEVGRSSVYVGDGGNEFYAENSVRSGFTLHQDYLGDARLQVDDESVLLDLAAHGGQQKQIQLVASQLGNPYLLLGDAPRLYGTDDTYYGHKPGLYMESNNGFAFDLMQGEPGIAGSKVVSAYTDSDYAYLDVYAYDGNDNFGFELGAKADGNDVYLRMDGQTWPYLYFALASGAEAMFNVEADADQWRIPIRNASNAVVGYLGHSVDDDSIGLWGGDTGVPTEYDNGSFRIYPDGWVNAFSGDGNSTLSLGTNAAYLNTPGTMRLTFGTLHFAGAAGIDGSDTPATLTQLADVLVDLGAIASHTITNPSGSGGPSFKQTLYAGGASNPTTTSSFADIDGTNLPALSLTLAVGDVVELVFRGGFQDDHNGGYVTQFDWLIDQPVSADTSIGATSGKHAAWHHEWPTTGGDADTLTITTTFVASEAGVHTFKPQWRNPGGGHTTTLTYTDANYDLPVLHRVTNLGQPAA